MPEPLAGHQQAWHEVAEYVEWARAFRYTPQQVDDLPIDFYNLALPINALYEARSVGVALSAAEPGWKEIPLNKSTE